MTDVKDKSPVKRKSMASEQAQPVSAKKAKTANENKTPKKGNTPNKQNNVTPNKKVVTPKQAIKGIQTPKSNNVQSSKKKNKGVEVAENSPKKLKMFSGTSEIAAKVSDKGKDKKPNPKAVKVENSVEATKKRRTALYFKIINNIRTNNNEEAIKEIDQKLELLESRKEQTKTSKKKMSLLKRLKRNALGETTLPDDTKLGASAATKRRDRKKALKEKLNKVEVKSENESDEAEQKPKKLIKRKTAKVEVESENEESDEAEQESEEESGDEKDAVSGESEEGDDESGEEEEEESDEDEEKSSMEVEGESSDDEEEEEEDQDDDDDDDEEEDDDSEASEEEVEVPVQKNVKGGKKNNAKNEQTKQVPKNKIGKNPVVEAKVNQKNAKNKTEVNLEQLKNADLVKPNQKRFVVFVGNLPFDTTKEELGEHFTKVGKIQHIRMPTDQHTNKPRGFAYVEVQNEESYQKCLSLHHSNLKGRRINVEYSQGGNKKGEEQKKIIKAKNFKLHAMVKQGQFAGSVKENQKRSFRRAKQRNGGQSED